MIWVWQVKPSLFYGDIVRSFAETCNLPVACYIVSGEYGPVVIILELSPFN